MYCTFFLTKQWPWWNGAADIRTQVAMNQVVASSQTIATAVPHNGWGVVIIVTDRVTAETAELVAAARSETERVGVVIIARVAEAEERLASLRAGAVGVLMGEPATDWHSIAEHAVDLGTAWVIEQRRRHLLHLFPILTQRLLAHGRPLMTMLKTVGQLVGETLSDARIFVFRAYPRAIGLRLRAISAWRPEHLQTLSLTAKQDLVHILEQTAPDFLPGKVIQIQPADTHATAVWRHLQLLAVPLFVQDQVWGMFCLCVDVSPEWTTADYEILAGLSRLLEAAVSNYELANQNQRQMRTADTLTGYLEQQTAELSALHDLSLAAVGINSVEDVLSELVRHVHEIIRPDLLLITIVQEHTRLLEVRRLVRYGENLHDGLEKSEFLLDSKEAGLTGWLIRKRKTLLVKDLLKDETPVPMNQIGRDFPRSWLGVPMVAYERVIGSISIQSLQPSMFDDRHVRFLEMIANQAALSVISVRLYEAEAAGRRSAERLHDLTSTLLRTLGDKDSVLQQAVAAVRDRFTGDVTCTITTLTKNEEELHVEYWWARHLNQDLYQVGDIISLSDTVLARRMIKDRQTVVVSDLEPLDFEGRPLSEMRRSAGTRAALYVPLLVEGRPIGGLHLSFWHEPRHFTEQDVAFCEAVASQAAIAIENARLIRQEREQLQLARTLRDMGALLTIDLTLDEVFERVFDLLARVVAYDSVSIQIYDEETQSFWLAASRGHKDEIFPAEIVSRLGHTVHQRIGQSRQQALAISDTGESGSWVPMDGAEHIRSWVGALLVIKDRLVGVLNVDNYQPGTYDDQTADTVLAFANQAVVAIENARLYESLNQRLMELATLNQVAVASAAAVNVEQLIVEATRTISEKLYGHNFGLVLINAAGQIDRYWFFENQEQRIENVHIPLESSIIGWVLKYGRARILEDVRDVDGYHQYDEQTRSEIAVPLLLEDRVIGAINAESPEVGMFTEDDLAFLTTLAGQLSSAIQRAKLFEEIEFYAMRLSDEVSQRTVELRAERDRMRAIFESAGEGILFTDGEKKVQLANVAAAAQTGYAVSDLIDRSVWSLLSHPDQRPQLTAEMGQWRRELQLRRRDGSTYDAAVAVSPLADVQNGLIGFVFVLSDISHHKAVDRLKSDFVTNVSHELRTPLTNIRTYVTLLQRGREDRRDHYHEVLIRETDRLTRLIQDLLDLSSLETGNEGESAPADWVDMIKLLQQVHRDYEALAIDKRTTLTLELPESLPTVWGNSDQLSQVVVNLVGNALAYTPRDGRIWLSAGYSTQGNQPMHVWFSVADDGIGINPEDMPRLFDRFFRGGAARRTQAPGTGLGLSICREIVQRHRGDIQVANNAHGGATFTVRLPTQR